MERWRNFLRDHYEQMYNKRREGEDSPVGSRVALARSIINEIELRGGGNQVLLDVGSGPQIMFTHLKTYPKFRNQYRDENRWLSFDISWISGRNLVFPDVQFQADGASIPVGSNVVDVLYSNMAVDFMPKNVWSEIGRVVKPGGSVLINLHHRNMVAGSPDDWGVSESVKEYWSYLVEKDVLFVDERSINECLGRVGLSMIKIVGQEDREGWWWEVKAKKL